MTIRSTSGMSASVCQTVTGGLPPILVSAAIMSRSRLRPGRRTTADFIRACRDFEWVQPVRAAPGGALCGRGVRRDAPEFHICYEYPPAPRQDAPDNVEFRLYLTDVLSQLGDLVMHSPHEPIDQFVGDFGHESLQPGPQAILIL